VIVVVQRLLDSESSLHKVFWLICTTSENFHITRDRSFSQLGIERDQGNKSIRINPNDRMVFYLNDVRRFAATVTVTSEPFESHDRIWKHHSEAEDFPHRVNIKPDLVLDEEQYLDGLQIGPGLEYVSKWPPEQWNMALLGMLHIISKRDFNFLEEQMRRLKSKKRRSNRRRRKGNELQIKTELEEPEVIVSNAEGNPKISGGQNADTSTQRPS